MEKPEVIPELEKISDLIRQGTPVGMFEAIAAIEYQKGHQAYRAHMKKVNSFGNRFRRFLGLSHVS